MSKLRCYQPAASLKALTRISRDIRSWALRHRSDKSLTELAQVYNPCIRGWITYYTRAHGAGSFDPWLKGLALRPAELV